MNVHLKKIIYYCIAFIISELLAAFVFYFVRKKLSKLTSKNTLSSTLKGTLERLVVYIGLAFGFQSIIMLFGALKIATRLKDEDEKISNNYFLIGNFLSILFVFVALFIFNIFNL